MNISDVEYNPFFGQLIWLKSSSNTSCGSIGGWINKDGYRMIKIDYRVHFAHRLIYELHHGPISEGMEIDHRNGRRDCNYIWNLRLATRNQNSYNGRLLARNTSGIKGVSWDKRREYWRANVQANGKRQEKAFTDFDEAADWVEEKRQELHGEFTNHG